MDIESVEALIPSYEEEMSILERLSDTTDFDQMCARVCDALGGKADNQTLLSIATVLLLFGMEQELPGDSDWAQAVAIALFEKFVQQDKASPRMMILLAANLLSRVVTKREYVRNIDKMFGSGYNEGTIKDQGD